MTNVSSIGDRRAVPVMAGRGGGGGRSWWECAQVERLLGWSGPAASFGQMGGEGGGAGEGREGWPAVQRDSQASSVGGQWGPAVLETGGSKKDTVLESSSDNARKRLQTCTLSLYLSSCLPHRKKAGHS